MEAGLGRSSGHGGLVVKKEDIKRDVESNGDIEEDYKQDFALKIGKGSYGDEISDEKKQFLPKQKDVINDKQVPETTETERSSVEPNSMASSLITKSQANDQLESTKAEIGEVMKENERLKMYLGRIMKDYQTLQVQFKNIVQQEAAKNPNNMNHNSTAEETELVSLSLGSFSGPPKTHFKDEKNSVAPASNNGKKIMVINHEKQLGHGDDGDQEGLSLGLAYKYISKPSNKSGATDEGGAAVSNPSAESSFEERKEEAGETWPPSKVLKPAKRATTSTAEQDEVSQAQNPAKKARVCVRARCDTPTMNDGCQWRKYGQKISKGNPCPRAYYRCTVAPSCPVRKQVQRCAEYMSILITTYEGTHNHPLPIAATAMASTTSAAASMLLSGSSTSSSTRSDALGFNTFESSKWNNNNNKQFYLPNSSTYSSFQASHPTITLDLTSTQPNTNNNISSPFLNKFSSSSSSSSSSPLASNFIHALYPSTSLSFGSSDSNTTNMSWGNFGTSSAQAQPYNLIKNQLVGTLGLGRQISMPFSQNPNPNPHPNHNYQNYIHHKITTNPSTSTSATTTTQVADTSTSSAIAAATKAITADPTFQSALAAALTSIIGGGQGNNTNNNNNILQGEIVQSLKWPIISSGDHHHHQQVQFPASTSGTSAINNALSKGNVAGCASTFLDKTTVAAATANPQAVAGSPVMFLSSNSLSFSASKSASASPGDT